ncbi:MAG: divergent PAP2 family protein [Oscillospiraceae bacterium]|nr:divergent PAP2 family protein [Oscillospiraceae bacterium]
MEEYYNPPLIAALVSWLIAQLIKTMYHIIRYRKISWERLLGSGGMPSSHSAAVCALCAVVARMGGVASLWFSLASMFALVTMYDALGVRRAAGRHAREINLLKRRFDADGMKQSQKELKELLGHTPLEVLCGLILGIGVGTMFPLQL